MDFINITGIDCHIGSQLTDLSPFEDTFIKLSNMIDHLKTLGIELDHIDIGGGIGITYNDEKNNAPQALCFHDKKIFIKI